MSQDEKKVGILVTHGTDTLAWTLPFVRYSIKNNHANICLTGSQIPLPATSAFSDAFINIQNSIKFLSTFVPPNIFAVFNYGRDAFSDSLRKVDKWDCHAFTGDLIGTMRYDSITLHDGSTQVTDPYRMDKFHVISTGGTIDSEPNSMGILSPGANHALGYITTNFSQLFKDLSLDPVFSVDSSDITIERMRQVSEKIASCLNETYKDTFADCRFSNDIRIIYTDPMKKLADYQREADGAEGLIIAGYGGGNVNIDTESGCSILPLIDQFTREKKVVVLSSQVTHGPTDFIYMNGSEAIKAGAIASIDLSIPESQLRLAYIIGHSKELTSRAEELGSSCYELAKRVFMSSVKFRNHFSRGLFKILAGFKPLDDDLLIDMPFEIAIKTLEL